MRTWIIHYFHLYSVRSLFIIFTVFVCTGYEPTAEKTAPVMDENAILQQTQADPHPFELLFFDVEWFGKKILLSWDAIEEWELVGYQIERSYDAIHFERIGWVWNREISREICYDFRDQNFKPNQPCFYRLKMVEFDGTMRYSPVRMAFPVSF